jgi:hypothetical protein
MINNFKTINKKHKKRKIKGYMVFDCYDIYDTTGDFTAIFKVIHKNKHICNAIFK